MTKNKVSVARNLNELTDLLDLASADAMAIEFRSSLNDKIIEIVRKKALTHVQVAKITNSSRTRITAILNRNTRNVSSDLMLRILARLGYRAKVSFLKAA